MPYCTNTDIMIFYVQKRFIYTGKPGTDHGIAGIAAKNITGK